MIITCPHCQTRYEVAERAIGDRGRSVQCANCANSWHADKSAAEPEPEPEPEMSAQQESVLDIAFEELDGSAATQAEAESAQGRRGGRRRAKALNRRHRDIARRLPAARARRFLGAGAVGLAAVLVVGLFVARGPIVNGVSDLASFYRMLGLEVNVVGLEFSEVRTVRAFRDGHEVLVVEGRIVNVSGRPLALPPVRVSLHRDDGTGVYEWRAAPGASALDAGESVRFETQLMAPPGDVARVRLRFEPGQRDATAARQTISGTGNA